MHDGEDPVTDVKIDRMKAMGPDGDRGWRVRVLRASGWQTVLDDGTRGRAERISDIGTMRRGHPPQVNTARA